MTDLEFLRSLKNLGIDMYYDGRFANQAIIKGALNRIPERIKRECVGKAYGQGRYVKWDDHWVIHFYTNSNYFEHFYNSMMEYLTLLHSDANAGHGIGKINDGPGVRG